MCRLYGRFRPRAHTYLPNGPSLPLTLSNKVAIFNPQWSFDSAYLSVGIRGKREWQKTAVLRLPTP